MALSPSLPRLCWPVLTPAERGALPEWHNRSCSPAPGALSARLDMLWEAVQDLLWGVGN